MFERMYHLYCKRKEGILTKKESEELEFLYAIQSFTKKYVDEVLEERYKEEKRCCK